MAADEPKPAFEPNDASARDAELARQWADWLAAAATGDARSFERFYLATASRSLAVARRVVGDGLCEDVVADAYFQAWQQAQRFDAARGSALAWVLNLVRSRAIDRLRQEHVRHGGLSSAPEQDDGELTDTNLPGPDTLLENLEQSHALQRALAGLAPNERWVLALAYYRDHSHSEIAAITQMPLGTVKSLINRAQQKLRDILLPPSAAPIR